MSIYTRLEDIRFLANDTEYITLSGEEIQQIIKAFEAEGWAPKDNRVQSEE